MTDDVLDNLANDSSSDNVDLSSDVSTNEPQVVAETKPLQSWPDNWRELMSGGDEKELKRLQRMASPEAQYKSYRELEKIKSSFTPPPKKPTADSTPEEVKAYRDAVGVPDDYNGYDLNFDDGTTIGDDQKPMVEGYLKYAHENNLSKDQVKNQLQWYMKDVAEQQQALYEKNEQAAVEGRVALKAEWGGEYQGNVNSIQSLFTDAPEGMMDSILNYRGADGLKFANNPDNIRWLVGLAKQVNPTASLLPVGANSEAGIDTELAKLQSQMNSSDTAERNKYWKDPQAQERFLKLTQAKAQMKQNSR